MKRLSVCLSLVLTLGMLLAACGPTQEGTEGPGVTATQGLTALPETTEPGKIEPAGTVSPLTEPAATEAVGTPTGSETEPAATETLAVTEIPASGGTEVLPPTGGFDPGRLSVLRTYEVCSQEGQQIGDVYDFVIGLDNLEVDYVIGNTARFEQGEEVIGKFIPVPWRSLEVRPDNGDGRADPCENVFMLTVSKDVFMNAPLFNQNAFPGLGVSAQGWDADLVAYWESGGTAALGTGTPVAEAMTATPAAEVANATPGAGATGTPAARQATAAPLATQPAGEGGRLLGVIRARQLVGYRLVGEDGQVLGSIRDALVDITTGKILYVVAEVKTAARETLLIAVPLQALRWDPTALSFGLTVDRATLEAAPAFEGQEFPDTRASGWDAEIQSYWSQFVEGVGES